MPSVSISRHAIDSDCLPNICILCGEPATTTALLCLSYNPRGPLPTDFVDLFFVANDFTKVKLALPVCIDHPKPFVWQATYDGWGATITFVGVVLGFIALHLVHPDASDAVAACTLLFLILAGAIWHIHLRRKRSRALHLSNVSETTITLGGVCQSFADACHAAARGQVDK